MVKRRELEPPTLQAKYGLSIEDFMLFTYLSEGDYSKFIKYMWRDYKDESSDDKWYHCPPLELLPPRTGKFMLCFNCENCMKYAIKQVKINRKTKKVKAFSRTLTFEELDKRAILYEEKYK